MPFTVSPHCRVLGGGPQALWGTPPLTAHPTGSKGNLCQRKVPLSISLALTIPAAVMAAYYLLLQTYALRLEAILNAILLLFYAVELLLGVLALVSFSRYRGRAVPGCRRSRHGEQPGRFGADMTSSSLLHSVDSY